ncbi:hypothetical protein M427DRAFT_58307 [Gonapodya prolifera JEL478]|uniref:Uncharacterized protein n=1 Tax=Gonapodya prolifera (strain JEL478) TaxID=1344416 RepID=A0A139AA63_GONPJ|nr:hypothetical protein M427DRAFT_58307 [Gonapodya prolifera JEL478]|eukprot:KXS13701.1 hypothetical protein M427DRAFT_58307 [Gonapodya prolifera JEL478]
MTTHHDQEAHGDGAETPLTTVLLNFVAAATPAHVPDEPRDLDTPRTFRDVPAQVHKTVSRTVSQNVIPPTKRTVGRLAPYEKLLLRSPHVQQLIEKTRLSPLATSTAAVTLVIIATGALARRLWKRYPKPTLLIVGLAGPLVATARVVGKEAELDREDASGTGIDVAKRRQEIEKVKTGLLAYWVLFGGFTFLDPFFDTTKRPAPNWWHFFKLLTLLATGYKTKARAALADSVFKPALTYTFTPRPDGDGSAQSASSGASSSWTSAFDSVGSTLSGFADSARAAFGGSAPGAPVHGAGSSADHPPAKAAALAVAEGTEDEFGMDEAPSKATTSPHGEWTPSPGTSRASSPRASVESVPALPATPAHPQSWFDVLTPDVQLPARNSREKGAGAKTKGFAMGKRAGKKVAAMVVTDVDGEDVGAKVEVQTLQATEGGVMA